MSLKDDLKDVGQNLKKTVCSRKFGLLMGGWAVISIGALYGSFCVRTGEFNPIKQAEHLYVKQNLLGKGGYADTNGDGKVDLEEKIEAYRKMGYDVKKTRKVDNEGSFKYELEYVVFPRATTEEMWDAVTMYEGEK